MKLAPTLLAALAILLSALAGAAPAPALAAPSNSHAAAKLTVKRASLVDLNHATLDQLKTLPGIGDAWAAKIVKNRPYENKSQLSSKGVLSAASYARIRTLIIAKQ